MVVVDRKSWHPIGQSLFESVIKIFIPSLVIFSFSCLIPPLVLLGLLCSLPSLLLARLLVCCRARNRLVIWGYKGKG